MKRIIKSLLKFLKLYPYISMMRFEILYGKRNDYRLNYKGLDITFLCHDNYSKHWFYPRYDNGRIHEPAIVDFLIEKLKPTHTFIDVGANLGFFTCVGASLCRNGQVHAFEMDPKCLPLIQANVTGNGFAHVHIVNAAVSDSNGTEYIPNLSEPNPRLMISKQGQGSSLLAVNAVALDDYFAKNNLTPDLMKIDAEGAEYKVLQGMRTFLKHSKTITMLVEIHCEKLKSFGVTYTDVVNLLSDLGLQLDEIVAHRKGTLQTRRIDSASVLQGNVMVLASK